MSDYVAHERRMAIWQSVPSIYQGMKSFDEAATAGLELPLVELVRLRASQINGCAFCVDMHSGDARAGGEDERRLDSLPVWREAPFFTARERAALELTESMTRLDTDGVADEVWDEAAKHFDETELAHLVGTIAAINSWNRVAIASRSQPPRHR